MAIIENPRKQFNFSIFAPGLNPFLAQKVTIPDIETDVVTHGDTNYLVKTGGIQKVGNLVIEKIAQATGPDSWVWAWIFQVQDTFIGGGLLPIIYKKTIEIQHFSVDGITVIDRWVCYGCYPSKVNGIELSRVDSNNTMENCEFQVDRVRKIPL